MRHVAVLAAAMLVTVSFAGCLESSAPSGRERSIAGVANAGWKPIVPVSRATLVGYDPDSYDDDLCYLAALPTAVFAGRDALYAAPLLYYRDQGTASSPEDRALNDTMGVTYFMRDWLAVNGHSLDRVDVIGDAPYEGKRTAHYGTDPFETSAALALDNWEYSREAVVVPVEPDIADQMAQVAGSVGGELAGGEVRVIDFSGNKLPDPVEPDLHDFDVPDGYEYVTAHLNWTWAGQTIGPDGSSATERGKDLDLQLYDLAIGEVSASEDWNVFDGSLYRPFDPPDEDCRSIAYHEGEWQAAVTYMPTKGVDAPVQTEELGRAYYNIRVKSYPGTVVDLPDQVAYMSGDVMIELDAPASLGLVLLGPSGEEMASAMDDSSPKRLELGSLGTGQYSIAVISLDGSGGDFTVEYSWEHTETPISANMLASAGQAAVYASMRNLPLIFVGPSSVPSSARRALDRLGVEKVRLFNLGGYSGVGGKFDFRSWDEPSIDVSEVRSHGDAYSMISGLSGEDSVVFTTIDGWKHWYPGSNGPEAQDERGTSIGPAAYAAAVHGAPLLVTDAHPELNGPVAWHNAYWARAFQTRQPPSVGSMVLTGHRVYDFLGALGLDGPGQESIVTVADHLNLGQAWDRTFVGVAMPGRVFGTPADQAMWVSRNALYPALVFANPAVNPMVDPFEGKRITGSRSESRPVFHIVDDESEVEAPYSVAQSWVSYQHRFNERASEYWGTAYVGPAGASPYWTESGEAIDEGNTNYPGDRGEGMYYPDMTCSEVIPFYAEKAGYSSVFTTSLEPTMENLNRGAIMWFEVMHGGHQSYDDGSGVVGFWNSEDQEEADPWRGYEADGCTEED
ncbi:MAG: hypothetical protein L0Z54_02710, partial [Thermoplasmata archaeon]|nr:hypothetical protein [Thermoplasmata archaeon]